MKKKTKKNILNTIIIILIFAMTFGGIGGVIFTIYYASVNKTLQEQYTAQLEEEIRRQMAEAQTASQSTAASLSAVAASDGAEIPPADLSQATETPTQTTPNSDPTALNTLPPPDAISLPTAPSLADFDTSIGN